MPMNCLTLLTDPTAFNPSGIGTIDEIPNTVRILDMQDVYAVRAQYQANKTGDASIEVQYSPDLGSTWFTLIPSGPTFIADTLIPNPPLLGVGRIIVPDAAKVSPTTYLRATGTGSHKLLPYTINFIELQYT